MMVEDYTKEEIYDVLQGHYKRGEIAVWTNPYISPQYFKGRFYPKISVGTIISGGCYFFIDLPTGRILTTITRSHGFNYAAYEFASCAQDYHKHLEDFSTIRCDLIALREYINATHTRSDHFINSSLFSRSIRFQEVFSYGYFVANEYGWTDEQSKTCG